MLVVRLSFVQEIKKAIPPNFKEVSSFEAALARLAEERGQCWLSQRLLLQQLLQVLGPDRVICFPPGDGLLRDQLSKSLSQKSLSRKSPSLIKF